MTPYYQRDNITLYCADCRDAVDVVAAGSIDAISADPPYGETSLEWDHWPDGWPAELAPLVKPSGSMWCFGSMRMFLQRKEEFHLFWKFTQEIIWEKHNGSGFHVDRFRRVHELACHFHLCDSKWAEVYKSPQYTNDATKRVVRKKEKTPHWNAAGPSTYVSEDGGPRLMRSVLHVRSCHGHAFNETQKPQGILRPLLAYACPAAGTVVVPFAGSGSDLLVARELGMTAIGFEVRESQCEIAANQLAQGILFT